MTKKPMPIAFNDPEDRKGALKEIGGSMSDNWNQVLANQTVQALWTAQSEPDVQAKQYGAAASALAGIAPQDELEGMLAAQLVAAHSAAMECFRRAMLPEQTAIGRQDNLSAANKLSRTFATSLEALNRHRGKGQQKVTVEHVHVYEGGQAIVGHVEGAGGGGRTKIEERTHALGYAPGETLWSENAEREALPVASGGEPPSMPNARRDEPGTAKG
jgi:hypothetical protein